ncbi:MAG: class I SAM-dependent methyltransferase [Actinomycetia bacterium]|nr:class I SAM-dependent methyltransferase [Actinomycetes bacterium]
MNGDFPAFFTDSAVSESYKEIGAFYDDFYGKMDDTWNQIASRGPEFVRFIASLVAKTCPTRYLDIGCGEGYQLAAITAPEKHGLDISCKALKVAARHSGANLGLAFAEQLPFSTGYFDAITSIGVMTHFVDDLAATREIHRVLNQAGRYIVGLFLRPAFTERIMAKISEFLYPHPTPVVFINCLKNKISSYLKGARKCDRIRKDYQPVERYYTQKSVEQLFDKAGFVVLELITKRRYPEAPLAGHHFRIYVLQKKRRNK